MAAGPLIYLPELLEANFLYKGLAEQAFYFPVVIVLVFLVVLLLSVRLDFGYQKSAFRSLDQKVGKIAGGFFVLVLTPRSVYKNTANLSGVFAWVPS